MPQESDFDPELTVAETLELFASAYGERWNGGLAQQRVASLQLRPEVRVEAMSTGFRQRLALVTALAAEPEILLLDEPTAGLDVLVRRDFAETVVDYMAGGEERTVVLSSHLLNEVEALADRVGILRPAGQDKSSMIVEGPVDELKEKILILRGSLLADPHPLQAEPGLLRSILGEPHTLVFWLDDTGSRDATLERLAGRGALGWEVADSSLEEIFFHLCRDLSGEDEAPHDGADPEGEAA